MNSGFGIDKISCLLGMVKRFIRDLIRSQLSNTHVPTGLIDLLQTSSRICSLLNMSLHGQTDFLAHRNPSRHYFVSVLFSPYPLPIHPLWRLAMSNQPEHMLCDELQLFHVVLWDFMRQCFDDAVQHISNIVQHIIKHLSLWPCDPDHLG